MQYARPLSLALAVGLAVSTTAHAQAGRSRPIEFGIDAALSYQDLDNASLTSFAVPVPRIRVGFFASDAISIEPFFSLQYNRTEVDDDLADVSFSLTQYDLGVGVLFHFASDRTRSQPYFRPFVGISGISADDDDDVDEDNSISQPIIGAAFGLKLPSTGRLGTRLEAGFARRLEDEPIEASNQLFLSFGLSFFTR